VEVNKRIRRKKHKNSKIVSEGERCCPICSEQMHVEKIKGISIDVCEEHGVWMDKGEFTAITDRIKLKIKTKQTEAIRKAKFEGKVSGNIWGTWSFFLD
jgi:Zn-finger nucleic acid-binding protein